MKNDRIIPANELSSVSSLSNSKIVDNSSTKSVSIIKKECTEWRKVYIGVFLLFFANFEKNVLSLTDWLYMKELDPSLTPEYLGVVIGVARIGHAITTILFSYWRQKAKTTKQGLLLGRLGDALAFSLYCAIEMFGSTKRYVFLIVYFIVYSFGFGSSITLRTYLVDVSLPEDRSSVFALRTLAVVGGMLLPPLLQLPFTSLDYPGIAIGTDMIRLNVYSGPLLITFLANIIATLTVIFLLSEPRITKKAIELKKAKRSENVSSVPFLKRLSNFFLKPNFSWHLIIVICVVKVGIYAALSTVSVVHAAWAQIAFGWSSAETVVQMTKAKIILGSVSVGITLFLFKFSKKVGDHLVLLICSIFMLGYFFITYPLSPLTVSTTAPFNASTHGGCNESEYSWCGARVGNPDLWVYSSVTVIIIIAQVGLISSDAIFSNFLEKIDQNMMQGMVVLFSDGVQMTASMYSADMFTAWGLEPLWILNVALAAIILLISIVYFKRFRWKTE